jgi:hypothetical protein
MKNRMLSRTSGNNMIALSHNMIVLAIWMLRTCIMLGAALIVTFMKGGNYL